MSCPFSLFKHNKPKRKQPFIQSPSFMVFPEGTKKNQKKKKKRHEIKQSKAEKINVQFRGCQTKREKKQKNNEKYLEAEALICQHALQLSLITKMSTTNPIQYVFSLVSYIFCLLFLLFFSTNFFSSSLYWHWPASQVFTNLQNK